MNLIVLDKVGYSIGDVNIISDASLTITERTRLGLVGPNGSGKTTLLNLIAGEVENTSGSIFRKPNLRISYLRQEQKISGKTSVLNAVLRQNPSWWKAYSKLESEAISISERDALWSQFLLQGGYSLIARAKEILNRLGISEEKHEISAGLLSGGEKNRLAIASVLLSEPDIMLLDEPTNHLDYQGLVWLGEFLKNSRIPFVLVSHDRYFLDITIEKTADIIDGKLVIFNGNFSHYETERRKIEERQLKLYKEQQAFIRKSEEFIQRNIARLSTSKRAQSRKKMLEKIEPVKIDTLEWKSFVFNIKPKLRGGDKVLWISKVSYKFDDRELISDFTAIVGRGERISVFGSNGCGKTTLLKLLVDKLPLQEGEIRRGKDILIAYYSQDFVELPQEGTPFSIITDAMPNWSPEQVRTHLSAFSVRGDEVFRQISSFSGGEKARIALAKLVLSGANLIVLDEPTNHLDIQARKALQEFLSQYEGTIIFASHDRCFIDAIANKMWAFENKKIVQYPGNLSEYLARTREAMTQVNGLNNTRKQVVPARQVSHKKVSRVSKESIRQTIESVEEKIVNAENEKQKLVELMSQDFVASNFKRVQNITEQIKQIDILLQELWRRWEDLTKDIDNR